jgi:hypothetical protein
MRAARTHFEQIPLDVVKKIAEAAIPRDENAVAGYVIVERTSRKSKPQATRARSLARKRR